jgi:hypothetical protein
MLLAAMILGLIGGIQYFIGGTAGTISEQWGYMNNAPWWVVSLIPIGVVGTLGGAVVRWRPSLGGFLLLLAGVSAIVIGLVSFDESLRQGDVLFSPPMVSTHPFDGPLEYLLSPLFALIIGGALAFAGRKPTGLPAPTTLGETITAFLKQLLR